MNDNPAILAVNDTSESLALPAKILTTAGCDIRPADSGGSTLAAVDADPPDLILLNVRMKGLRGLVVSRRLKANEDTRHIPIKEAQDLPGYSNNAIDRQGILEAGINFIGKPFAATDLARKVRDTTGTIKESLRVK